MRLTRIHTSTKELDEKEHTWWNTNSDLIETIWANSYQIQKAIREPYLKRMKKFFLKDAKSLPVNILEVGCGTGWVCRLIADKNFHVVGTDFSESQINRAKQESICFDKAEYCKYQLANASTFDKEYDGVVIHAFLHHLTIDELAIFFNEFSKRRKETKVFVYEPVFYEPTQKAGVTEKILNRSINLLKKIAFNRIEKTRPLNKSLLNQWKKIYDLAQEEGWYISPKEVPFYENEIHDYLNKYCTILDEYIVTHTDLDIAQKLILHDVQSPSFFFTKFIFPIIQQLEKQFFKRNFRPFIYKNQHLFVCYELIIK